MAKKNSCLMRVESDFAKAFKQIPIDRIRNGSENVKISDREVTRMAMNAPAWQSLINDLKTKPRRKL